ncbi:hypothetical protein ACWCP6_26045 [Streptomyces sp. NPDC002004]
MSDTVGPDCDRLRDVAEELALGVLPAGERAAAMEHLDRCSACREHVHELSRTADAVLDLVPAADPPPGFEERVLQRLGLPATRSSRRPRRGRRLALALAAAVASVALGGLGWTLGTNFGQPPSITSAQSPGQQLRAARLTGDGHEMGHAYLFSGPSSWMFMSLDAPGHSGPVSCQLQRADGSRVTAGTFTLPKDGDGYYGTGFPASSSPVTDVRLVQADGSVLATAHFGPATA